jgi:hypothetical protein
MRFRDGSHKGTASNCVQISEKVRWKTWQRFDKGSGEIQEPTRNVQVTETEKSATGIEQSQKHAHNFL